MSKPYYTDYVRHCLRFYTRNPTVSRFNTEADRFNWYACHRVMEIRPSEERAIFVQVYSSRDTLADNVYEVAKAKGIDQNIIWELLKDFERAVAEKRGLI